MAMAMISFFTKIPEWQWHYNPTLDSLYLTASSYVCLYIFFQRPFVVLVLSSFFNLEAPFDGIPLYMAHLAAASPQPIPLASMESNPSKASSSSSSTFASGDSRHPPGEPRSFKSLGKWIHHPRVGLWGYARSFRRPFS